MRRFRPSSWKRLCAALLLLAVGLPVSAGAAIFDPSGEEEEAPFDITADSVEYDPDRNVSQVVATLCKGCGTCVAACPAQVISGAHFSNDQIYAEIEGLLADAVWPPFEPELATTGSTGGSDD